MNTEPIAASEIDELVRQAEQFIERRDPAARQLAETLLKKSVASGNIGFIIHAKYVLSYYFCLIENSYDKAISLCNETVRTYSPHEIAPVAYKIYMALGNSYQMKGDVFSAQIHYMKGLRELEQKPLLTRTEQGFLASFYYNLSDLLGKSELHIDEEEYLEKAIKLYEERGSLVKLSKSYSAYAGIFERKKEYAKAIEVMLTTLKLALQLEDAYSIALSKANLGILYFKTHDPVTAHSYLNEALDYFTDKNMMHEIGLVKYNMGEALCATNEYDEGIATLFEAEKIFEKLDNRKELLNVYEALSRFIALQGNHELALNYHRNYVACLKQIFDIEKTNALARAKEEFESELKEKEKALLREKNEEIKQYATSLETANKDLELFSYSVSHDLRAPLRSINGFSKLLLKKHANQLDEEGKQYLQYVGNNALHMGKLIDELLQFSRVGKISINKKETDMNYLLDGVIAELRAAFPDSRAAMHIHKLLPGKCDPVLMKQVWINLVSNAIKYSSKKPDPVIEIGSITQNGANTYYVKDNGAGFDMKYAANLFGIFRRLHTDSEFEGTGIGLAFVHRIISKHGGEIRAEAKVNEGASFYFTIPSL
jgi:signal transduction histidine kinase